MPVPLSESAIRRLKRKLRLLEYCRTSPGFNDLASYAENDGIASRGTVSAIVGEFVTKKWVVRVGEVARGRKVQYNLTSTGELEVKDGRDMLGGRYTKLIPLGLFETKIVFPKDNTLGLVSDAVRDSIEDALKDPKKARELGTLSGSILTTYAQHQTTQGTFARGVFTHDGVFTLACALSKDESLKLRRMADLGHFKPGSEVAQLASLFYILGYRTLSEIYQAHARTNFVVGESSAVMVALGLDEKGIFRDTLTEIDNLRLLRMVKEEVERQIQILEV